MKFAWMKKKEKKGALPVRKWWSVVSTVRDDGSISARVTGICRKQKRKPKTTVEDLPWADVYTDWFGSMEDAEEFAAAAKEA